MLLSSAWVAIQAGLPTDDLEEQHILELSTEQVEQSVLAGELLASHEVSSPFNSDVL